MSTLTYPAGFKRLQGGGAAVDVISKAASYTFTREDSGRIFVATAVDLTFTLPATELGLVYTVVVKTPSVTTGCTVAPAAVDKVMGNGFTSLDNKGANNTPATDREGDTIQLVGDGLDGWFILFVDGTWARVA